MKLYCFLLIIIIIIFLYDNKLYEGNDHEDQGDSGGDDGGDSDSLISGSFLPDFLTGDSESDSSSNNCSIDRDCSENLIHRDMDWGYNTDNVNSWRENKQNCVECLKCKTGGGGAIIDSYYGHVCDAIVGCLDSTSEYSTNKLPYVYAYKITDWDNQCEESTSCSFFNDNSVLDSLSLLYVNDIGTCTAKIAELDLEQHACDISGGLLC